MLAHLDHVPNHRRFRERGCDYRFRKVNQITVAKKDNVECFSNLNRVVFANEREIARIQPNKVREPGFVLS